jgi:hypothetical protein
MPDPIDPGIFDKQGPLVQPAIDAWPRQACLQELRARDVAVLRKGDARDLQLNRPTLASHIEA